MPNADSYMNPTGSIIALDMGQQRIGVAVAATSSRLPHPLTTLTSGGEVLSRVQDLIRHHHAEALVIGLPRGLNGQDTAQTKEVKALGNQLKKQLKIPVYWQDESVTSLKAEQELQARRKQYSKEDIDSLAATYILEDFLQTHPKGEDK